MIERLPSIVDISHIEQLLVESRLHLFFKERVDVDVILCLTEHENIYTPEITSKLGKKVPVVINFNRITIKWASLRRFAGITVDSAVDAIKQGNFHVATYFAKILYFLPFAPRSLEKILTYAMVKLAYAYIRKDPNLCEITVNEVPGFEPDETDNVKAVFESINEIGLASLVSPDKIRFQLDTGLVSIIKPVAGYVTDNISLQNIDLESMSYPYRVVSGISSLYAMQKSNRLPSAFTVMMGLVSPVAWVEKDGTIGRKNTIEPEEWDKARSNMSRIKKVKERFGVEYFKAIGIMYENKVITKVYPIEVSGDMIDYVIIPTYYRYYTLMRQRRLSRRRS